MSRWWFQIFAIFIPNLGEMIQFDEYFSDVLQPPASQKVQILMAGVFFLQQPCQCSFFSPPYPKKTNKKPTNKNQNPLPHNSPQKKTDQIGLSSWHVLHARLALFVGIFDPRFLGTSVAWKNVSGVVFFGVRHFGWHKFCRWSLLFFYPGPWWKREFLSKQNQGVAVDTSNFWKKDPTTRGK